MMGYPQQGGSQKACVSSYPLPSSPQTVRFKSELERNITIKLGYANAKIYMCKDPECPRPGNFLTRGSSTEDIVKVSPHPPTLTSVRHVACYLLHAA